MNFCPNCGNETEDKFCDQCGTEMPIQQVAVENKDHKGELVFTKNKTVIVFIVLFSVAALLSRLNYMGLFYD
ncbi:MAG: hypothetical protein GX802_06175, partial [Clostridiales bacterium]|nr:hypothetical protein [Clostridiales bacterium]